MSMFPRQLPVIDSCDHCGACCLVVARPPFRHDFDDQGEDAWERLRSDRPDLFEALIDDETSRRAEGRPSYGTPCIWLDAETRRCLHYELRPHACREFAVGDDDCRDARRRAGVVPH